jgi:hypothetical protein
MTAFTTLWLYMLTQWVAGLSSFMDAIFMISITVRWMLMFLPGTPEFDYYQTSKTATKLDSASGDEWDAIHYRLSSHPLYTGKYTTIVSKGLSQQSKSNSESEITNSWS